MTFTQIILPSEVLAALGLPDIPYEVPTVYFDHYGVALDDPPLEAMLYALQKRAAHEKADWLKLGPAMDALVHALGERVWSGARIIDRPDFSLPLAEVDLDGDVIAIQRQGRIVAVLAQTDGGRIKAQLFHPPCARTVETLIGFSRNADENGKLPYYGTPWNSAEDAAASNGQYYAAMEGRTFLAHWSHGVGLGWDEEPVPEWIAAREHLQLWPDEPSTGAIAISAYAAIRDLLESLPQEERREEELPAFYARSETVVADPEPEPASEPVLPLNAYNLSQPSGRFAFLWSLYNDYQEDGLLMAVNHVWNFLDKPRSLRCALMAQKVGKAGTGRKALLRFLSRFLEEALYEFEVPDLPDRSAYQSAEEWNTDCLAHFTRLEARMTAIIARHEAILDGRDPEDVEPLPTGVVIKGPWVRSPT